LRLVLLYCQRFHVALEKLGHTTWKHAGLEKGVEADACYYIQDPRRTAAERLDLPPDIAVEIDIISESLKKLPIYAALGIPEIWRYDGRTFRFYELVDGSYVETASSRFLPKLTGSMLTESIEIKRAQSQTEAREAFRQRIQSLK
jgi:Uma2 family endonuclease